MAENITEFIGGCKIVKLKVVDQGDVILNINQHNESMGDIFKSSIRQYWIENLSTDTESARGGHVHHNDNHELMLRLYGDPITIQLHFPSGGCQDFVLKYRGEGLLVPPGVHHTVILPPQTGLLVIASENYDHASETTDKPCQCK